MKYTKCPSCKGRLNLINKYGTCCQRALRLEQIRSQARVRECSVCNAKIGEACISKKGKTRKSNHLERYERPFGAAQSQAPSLPF